MDKLLLLIGTRPELIKCAPFIAEMKRRGLRKNLIIVNTGQHRELIISTLKLLGLKADHTLDCMVQGQSLNELCARTLKQLQSLLNKLKARSVSIRYLITQGDTATAMAGAMTAFHNKIPFAHIEAGLRTNDFENPFPEEYYRKIISLYAEVHFAPTEEAHRNLVIEGVPEDRILITGNTVVDALEMISRIESNPETAGPVRTFSGKENLVLVTCHRRENFRQLSNIVTAVKEIVIKHPGFHFLWLRHPNPAVQWAAEELANCADNIEVLEPLDYFEMIQLLPKLRIIMTDSGGLQEEAPSFKVPVIVLREKTERIESIKSGYAFLCGAEVEKIKSAFDYCAGENINIEHNPYGDGKASCRIADYFSSRLLKESKITVESVQNHEANT